MSVATTYARALLETANDQKLGETQIQELESQLKDFAQLLSASREAQIALVGPRLSNKEKEKVLAAYSQKAGTSELLQKYLTLLIRRGRLGMIADIGRAFSEMLLEQSGGVLGNLYSAEPLDSAEIAELEKVFSQKLGKKVVFHVLLDPSLVAGVKVEIGGVSYDGSVRAQIQKLRDQLVHGIDAVR